MCKEMRVHRRLQHSSGRDQGASHRRERFGSLPRGWVPASRGLRGKSGFVWSSPCALAGGTLSPADRGARWGGRFLSPLATMQSYDIRTLGGAGGVCGGGGGHPGRGPPCQGPPCGVAWQAVPEPLGGRLPLRLLSQGPSWRDSQCRFRVWPGSVPVTASPWDQVSALQEGAAWETAPRPQGALGGRPHLPLPGPRGRGKGSLAERASCPQNLPCVPWDCPVPPHPQAPPEPTRRSATGIPHAELSSCRSL